MVHAARNEERTIRSIIQSKYAIFACDDDICMKLDNEMEILLKSHPHGNKSPCSKRKPIGLPGEGALASLSAEPADLSAGENHLAAHFLCGILNFAYIMALPAPGSEMLTKYFRTWKCGKIP